MSFIEDGIGIVCGLLFLVLLLNLGILLPILRRGVKNTGNPFSNFRSSRHIEREAINELRRKIEDLDIAHAQEKTNRNDK